MGPILMRHIQVWVWQRPCMLCLEVVTRLSALGVLNLDSPHPPNERRKQLTCHWSAPSLNTVPWWGIHWYLQKDTERRECPASCCPLIKQHYRWRHPGCITAMLKDLELPPLAERRKHQWLIFMQMGWSLLLFHQTYLIPLEHKPQIRLPPKRRTKSDDFRTSTVDPSARKNTRC